MRCKDIDRYVSLQVPRQHARPKVPSCERLGICSHRELRSRSAGDVVERLWLEHGLGSLFPVRGRDRPFSLALAINLVLDFGAVEAHGSATLTRSLPRFSPRRSPMNARGARSMPSTTSSR